MAIRIRLGVNVAISSTTAEDKDLGYSQYEIVSDAQNEGGNWKTRLAAGAVNIQAQLGNIASVKFLSIKTTVANPLDTPGLVQVRKDSPSGEIITVTPLTDTKEGHLIITTSGITAIYLSNPGTVDMDVTIAAAGD